MTIFNNFLFYLWGKSPFLTILVASVSVVNNYVLMLFVWRTEVESAGEKKDAECREMGSVLGRHAVTGIWGQQHR